MKPGLGMGTRVGPEDALRFWHAHPSSVSTTDSRHGGAFGILERPRCEAVMSAPGVDSPRARSTTTVVAYAAADTRRPFSITSGCEFVTIGGPAAARVLLPVGADAGALPCRSLSGFPGPHDAEGLDPFAGMTAANVTEYAAAGQGGRKR